MQAHAVKLSREGRVLIPVDVRAELGLSEGATLSLRVQDGEIRLFDRAQALRRAQQIAAKYKKPVSFQRSGLPALTDQFVHDTYTGFFVLGCNLLGTA